MRATERNAISMGSPQRKLRNFFAQDVFVTPDISHSQEEERFLAVGRSRKSKTMMVVFTFRESKGKLLIRPISARYMREKESKRYEQEDSKIEK